MLLIFKFDNANVTAEIKKFEEKYKLKICEQHKEFLLKYNGGKTPKTDFNINRESSGIRAFYGFGNEYYDYNTEEFLYNHIELSYLPIATDSLANKIVIGIGKENEGEIYFFDSEESKYVYLTKDLKKFIGKVKSKKYAPLSIEQRIQGMKEVGSTIEVDDELIEIWQEEINKYKGQVQEKVIL